MKTVLAGIIPGLLSLGIVACFAGCDTNDIDPPLRTKEYILTKIAGAGITGRAVFKENRNKSFNVEIKMDSSVKDTIHIVHIHNGSIENPASVALLLKDIQGTRSAVTSTTENITTRLATDGSVRPMNYDSVLVLNGYIDIHYSSSKPDSVISRGNIGKN